MHRMQTPNLAHRWNHHAANKNAAREMVLGDLLGQHGQARPFGIGPFPEGRYRLEMRLDHAHKIRKAMKARDANYQLTRLIQVDDAFFKGGVSKGGDKRGRGTSKVPVLVLAATKDEAITLAKMEVLENVDKDHI